MRTLREHGQKASLRQEIVDGIRASARHPVRVAGATALGGVVAAALFAFGPAAPEAPTRLAAATPAIPAVVVGAVPSVERAEPPWRRPRLDPLTPRPRDHEPLVYAARPAASPLPRASRPSSIPPPLPASPEPDTAPARPRATRESDAALPLVMPTDDRHAGPTLTTRKHIAQLITHEPDAAADDEPAPEEPAEQAPRATSPKPAAPGKREEPAARPRPAPRPRPERRPEEEFFAVSPDRFGHLDPVPRLNESTQPPKPLPQLPDFDARAEREAPLTLPHQSPDPKLPHVLGVTWIDHPFATPSGKDAAGGAAEVVPGAQKPIGDLAPARAEPMQSGGRPVLRVVPEPASGALLAAGLALLARRRRERR